MAGARRLRPPKDPVEIQHDGETVIAERDQSIAQALIGAGRISLARSPKMHRPRGPYCLRGGCDGCLARVDGVPNVMTCLRRARGGERVETQNVLGTRGVDMLRAADFLFPHGLDHHKLLAGIRGVSGVVQSFARRVAGLGRLPDETLERLAAKRRELDVLVVGGGRAGLAAAAELSGSNALLVDDAIELGGSDRALDPAAATRAIGRARETGIELASETVAIAVYPEPSNDRRVLHAVTVGPSGATLIEARAIVLATGRHEPVLGFANNDLPGVFSARAALLLWRSNITLGDRVACVGSSGFCKAFIQAAGSSVDCLALPAKAFERAVGRSAVTAIVHDGKHERVDALIVDGPAAPALELAVQAGASASFDRQRGVYRLDTSTLISNLDCAGSVADAELDSPEDGARVGRAVRASFR